MPKRNWEAVVRADDFSNTMRLVHLAVRLDEFDAERMGTELMRMARRAYESELTLQARRIGCGKRAGRLTNGSILRELSDQGKTWAVGIINTYNYDVARAIEQIRAATPSANRHVYASRLRVWETQRSAWKSPQIAQGTEGWARSKAQQDFAEHNRATGYAVLRPKRAVCEVCIGWVKRGKIPMEVALNNPPPYHQNCPHLHVLFYDQFTEAECETIWLGE